MPSKRHLAYLVQCDQQGIILKHLTQRKVVFVAEVLFVAEAVVAHEIPESLSKRRF